jgi:hypothetical protein
MTFKLDLRLSSTTPNSPSEIEQSHSESIVSSSDVLEVLELQESNDRYRNQVVHMAKEIERLVKQKQVAEDAVQRAKVQKELSEAVKREKEKETLSIEDMMKQI